MKKSLQLTVSGAIFILISFLSNSQVSAQNVFIPDANFKAALVADAAINTNADAEISYAEAYAFTGMIDVNALGITNLTGIEAFTAATGLDCSSNSITNLDLTTCTSLGSIDCSNNNLTNLRLFGLTSLSTLYCGNNSLTCLDLHSNVSLTVLDCGPNNLTSLNLKNGNNASMSMMNSLAAGSMLYYIQVDDSAAAIANPFFVEDTWSTYRNSYGTPVLANFTHTAPVCFGSPVVFTDASVGGVSNFWHWSFGDGTFASTQNATHIYGGGAYNWVELIVGNCYRSDTIGITVQQGNDITGHVGYSLGNVTNGTAVLMPFTGTFEMFDTMYTSPLDVSGNYTFPHVIDGNYIIKVFPDSFTYPTLIPTYYTSEWLWDSANVFTQGCTIAGVADVIMFELTNNGSGPGVASGFIFEGPSFGRAQGDPIHGVDVKLGITGSSQIIDVTETGNDGGFTFTNINFGTYTVYADIPGLIRDSVYTFTVDSTTNIFMNLNYLVDSVNIYIAPGIGIETIEDLNLNTLQVYPNPSKDISNIYFSLINSAQVKLEVYNIYGIKMFSLLDDDLPAGEYNNSFNPTQSALDAGTYFITLTVNGKSKTIRTVVLK